MTTAAKTGDSCALPRFLTCKKPVQERSKCALQLRKLLREAPSDDHRTVSLCCLTALVQSRVRGLILDCSGIDRAEDRHSAILGIAQWLPRVVCDLPVVLLRCNADTTAKDVAECAQKLKAKAEAVSVAYGDEPPRTIVDPSIDLNNSPGEPGAPPLQSVSLTKSSESLGNQLKGGQNGIPAVFIVVDLHMASRVVQGVVAEILERQRFSLGGTVEALPERTVVFSSVGSNAEGCEIIYTMRKRYLLSCWVQHGLNFVDAWRVSGPVCTWQDILPLEKEALGIFLALETSDYMWDVVVSLRRLEDPGSDLVVVGGCDTVANVAMELVCQSYTLLLTGNNYVTPDMVTRAARSVLGHVFEVANSSHLSYSERDGIVRRAIQQVDPQIPAGRIVR